MLGSFDFAAGHNHRDSATNSNRCIRYMRQIDETASDRALQTHKAIWAGCLVDESDNGKIVVGRHPERFVLGATVLGNFGIITKPQQGITIQEFIYFTHAVSIN